MSKVFQVGHGFVVVCVDKIFLANHRAFAGGAFFGDKTWQIFGHGISPLNLFTWEKYHFYLDESPRECKRASCA